MGVQIIYGIHNKDTGAIVGKKVKDALNYIRDMFFNIPSGALFTVNGEESDLDYVLADNDVLEIAKVSGKKGC